MQNSRRDKLKTVKRKFATLQEEHGGQSDFVIMIRNNVTNSSSMEGKNLVMAESPLREKLHGPGGNFVKKDSYMFANSWNMAEDIFQDEEEESGREEENDEEEEKALSPNR